MEAANVLGHARSVVCCVKPANPCAAAVVVGWWCAPPLHVSIAKAAATPQFDLVHKFFEEGG